MQKYDLIIVLGSQLQVLKNEKGEENYELAPHTLEKAMAAVIAWKLRLTPAFIISGGYAFGVRYDDCKIIKPNFSLGALVNARIKPSEAETIKDFMVKLKVPPELILTEETSLTTEESIRILGILLKRDAFSSAKTIGLITTPAHMGKALRLFSEVGVEVQPISIKTLLTLRKTE